MLSPGSVSGTITSVTWKHGPDIAVEWYGEDTIAYRDFKGTVTRDLTGNTREHRLKQYFSRVFLSYQSRLHVFIKINSVLDKDNLVK